MSDEESNANAFLIAVSAIDGSTMPVVKKYEAILQLAKGELE